MKTNFSYDYEKALSLCCQYSENPDKLKSLLACGRLKIEANRGPVMPSPFNDSGRKLNALFYQVTVNGYGFPFYGSHNDAGAFSQHTPFTGFKDAKKIAEKRRTVNDGFLYSILCCIKSDLTCFEYDPEDLGYDPDSIRDMAKWNEGKEHSRKLRAALGLTAEEVEALPS